MFEWAQRIQGMQVHRAVYVYDDDDDDDEL